MIWFRISASRARKVFCSASLAALVLSCAPGAAQAAAQTASSGLKTPTSPIEAPLPDLPAQGQQTFASAQAAVQALVTAVREHDNTALAKMLEPAAGKLLSSGDPAEDRRNRDRFLKKYAQMHRMVTEQNGLTTLYVGAENWPTPIPLARRGHLWYFDTPAGEKEVLYRRIGQNELTAIRICGELADAERDYFAQARGAAKQGQYAQKMLSRPGKQDGLYWQPAPGAPESPLGPLLAAAEQDGYSEAASPRRTPFYGYYFRILKAQGPAAPGGAKSYLSGGKMTGGFAFLAYPAEYRSSGVMTLMAGPGGVVYQKDLGPKTAQIARSIATFNPDPTWAKAD